MTSLPALVLFDLDGTLVDPAGAITGGISRALQLAGLPVPQQDVLDSMVGPPLGLSLREKAGVPESDLAEVIRLYRTEYRVSGMAASHVYPGMEGLLQQLKTEGTILAVATQKPTPIADELLRVQGLTAYFESVHGAGFDDPGSSAAADAGKIPILEEALRRYAGAYGSVVMVGDRHYDITAAVHHGIPAIGVGWGFAADGELEAAGAAAVVVNTQELAEELALQLAAATQGKER